MSDEESKLFSLKEAESLRHRLEPILVESMELRRKLLGLDSELVSLAEKIQRSGGMTISYDKAAQSRMLRNRAHEELQRNLEKIQATGCVVKDLDIGLLDFPARIDNQAVYLCWKLGEDRIRFYHRRDEGFSGRKPIQPSDGDYTGLIQ